MELKCFRICKVASTGKRRLFTISPSTPSLGQFLSFFPASYNISIVSQLCQVHFARAHTIWTRFVVIPFALARCRLFGPLPCIIRGSACTLWRRLVPCFCFSLL